ncbi:MAG: Ig-like domain-containing protein [Lachnospiraceae bacterium]|nr:Ig-like domain-containing protein [Lachnospiraceae bacterium]
MRKRLSKIIIFLSLAVFIAASFGIYRATAADEYTFTFYLGGDKDVENGGVVNYSQLSKNIDDVIDGLEDQTIRLFLRSNNPLPEGITVDWEVVDSKIITIKETDAATMSCTLNIMGPGYSGLFANITTPDKKVYSAYCTIYVPLEWSDNEATRNLVANNIFAKDNADKYGLIFAHDEDSDSKNKVNNYTVQLYTPDSTDHPNRYHYLRKLKYITYSYKEDNPDTPDVNEYALPSVPSDVTAEELGSCVAAIEWFSSNTDVAEVDSKSGIVTAKSAGFTTITAATTTSEKNDDPKSGSMISYDVVVVPEASVSGIEPNKHCSIEDPEAIAKNMSAVTLITNARLANTLEWRVFRGDVISANTDITKDLKDDISVSDTDGTMTLNNLKAGVYTITAVQIKNKEKATTTPTYDVVSTNINFISYHIIVPIQFPPSDIILSYYNQNIYDSFDLLANSNLPQGLFRFTSKDANIAKVGPENGMIDATGEGTTQVTISLQDPDKFKTLYGSYYDKVDKVNYDLNVKEDKIVNVSVFDGIAINSSNATMTLGSTLQLSLTAPSPYEGKVYWETTDKSIASVDDSGLVTANKVGEAVITARIVVGSGVSKRAQCKVKVVTTINSIKLVANSDVVSVDENLTITAEITPKLNDVALKWTSSDMKVATIVDQSALSVTIKGLKQGTTVITAVNPDNGVVGTMMIKVTSAIEKIELSDTEVVISKSAGFYQLYAKCTPELPENEKLTWTSTDTKVITVDQNGKVSIVKPGNAIINVVTENGKMATCKFTILQGMEAIQLDETNLVMYVGDTYRMTYTVKPATTSDPTLKWTSNDPKIVTVDNTGFFTAKNTGSTIVTVQAMDGSGIFTTCTVTVYRNASDIKVDVTSLTLNVGESYQLNAIPNPADSTDTLLYESSNTKVATVSVTGKITAKSKGSCIVFVRTDAGASNYVNVTVTQQVTGIKVTPASAEIYVGESMELTVDITPKNASDKEVTWVSNDKSICTVDENGKITGVSGGSTIVKCTSLDGDFMSFCFVNVTEKVTLITVEESAEVGVGKKLKLNATVSGQKATNKDVKWASSNKKVCKVSKKGVIKGVKSGTCTIRVKAADGSGVYADCEVRVIKATDSISLSATYVELIQGRSIKLKATTNPKKVTYAPVWSTDNDNVAIVSKKGKVTALKPGDCVIKCTSGDNSEVYAVCYVHVTAPVNISSINFSEEAMVMVAGEQLSVQYSVTPSNYTESFSWASDNPAIASVDQNGKVTARKIGTARVTALSKSGKKATIEVYVVGISKTKITLHQYESTKINLQLDGVGAGKIDVRWDTDNQSIAEIANGKVTGKALGTTTVYAIVNGRYLACTVKVIKN